MVGGKTIVTKTKTKKRSKTKVKEKNWPKTKKNNNNTIWGDVNGLDNISKLLNYTSKTKKR